MPSPSDINAQIDDPTQQLTEADLDPIGSAQKEAPKWVGQGQGAASRLANDHGATLYGPMDNTYRTRQDALDMAIKSSTIEDSADTEGIVARAKAFEAFLSGEVVEDGEAAE